MHFQVVILYQSGQSWINDLWGSKIAYGTKPVTPISYKIVTGMENIDLDDALNAGTYYPDGTSKWYSTFLNKFGDGRYVHGDMKTMISKEHFNDITLG